MLPFWERLRGAPRLKAAFLIGTVGLLTLAAALIPNAQESLLADAERFAFDLQVRLLRELHPRALAADVVLVGVDERSEQAFEEPIALWHRRFAQLLHALALAQPRAVGMDFVLPERSYDDIVPGLDLAMMRGIVDLRRVAPLVYVQTLDERGALLPVQPNFRGVVPAESLGIDQHLRDPDSVSRRFSERELSATGRPVPTFAGQVLRSLGIAVDEGYIDYSVGTPVHYIPMQEVIAARDDARKLQAWFGGRIVLVGSVVRRTDRWQLPVRLMAAAESGASGRLAYSQPGALVHLQVLRSHLASGLLHPVPEVVRVLLMLLAALMVLSRGRLPAMLAAALLVPLGLGIAGMVSIATVQWLLPVASVTLVFWLALVARGVFDAADAVMDRLRLQQSFAGQVSPDVMREILHGGLSPGLGGQQAEICVLFSDVRDFTTLTENLPAEVVTAVLQRYFDRMVRAVHRFDGTVDKFIGDGMMVLFGAPRKLADPCGAAVQCALAMMAELDELNVEFAREGLPTLVIGIGINYGTVTVGNIGSSERHNYSAIGDAVNVAARVEGLTKALGRKIVITEAVVSRIAERYHFDPLGSHHVKGHSPVKVWGIRTAHVAPAQAAAEAAP